MDEIPAEPYFSLDKESRDLSNNVVLDREKNDSITLYVLVIQVEIKICVVKYDIPLIICYVKL